MLVYLDVSGSMDSVRWLDPRRRQCVTARKELAEHFHALMQALLPKKSERGSSALDGSEQALKEALNRSINVGDLRFFVFAKNLEEIQQLDQLGWLEARAEGCHWEKECFKLCSAEISANVGPNRTALKRPLDHLASVARTCRHGSVIALVVSDFVDHGNDEKRPRITLPECLVHATHDGHNLRLFGLLDSSKSDSSTPIQRASSRLSFLSLLQSELGSVRIATLPWVDPTEIEAARPSGLERLTPALLIREADQLRKHLANSTVEPTLNGWIFSVKGQASPIESASLVCDERPQPVPLEVSLAVAGGGQSSEPMLRYFLSSPACDVLEQCRTGRRLLVKPRGLGAFSKALSRQPPVICGGRIEIESPGYFQDRLYRMTARVEVIQPLKPHGPPSDGEPCREEILNVKWLNGKHSGRALRLSPVLPRVPTGRSLPDSVRSRKVECLIEDNIAPPMAHDILRPGVVSLYCGETFNADRPCLELEAQDITGAKIWPPIVLVGLLACNLLSRLFVRRHHWLALLGVFVGAIPLLGIAGFHAIEELLLEDWAKAVGISLLVVSFGLVFFEAWILTGRALHRARSGFEKHLNTQLLLTIQLGAAILWLGTIAYCGYLVSSWPTAAEALAQTTPTLHCGTQPSGELPDIYSAKLPFSAGASF